MLTPDGAKAYVSNKQTPYIGVIDTALRKLVKRIPMPRGIQNLAVSPDGRRLYAVDFSEPLLHVVDTATDAASRVVTLRHKTGPGRVQVTPDNRFVLVTSNEASALEIIDSTSLQVRSSVPVEKGPMGVMPSADSRMAFVANQDADSLTVVDIERGQAVRRIAAAGGPEFVLYTTASPAAAAQEAALPTDTR